MNLFERELLAHGHAGLFASGLDCVQVNVGLRCNLACAHCHHEAGADRSEVMEWETFSLILDRTRGLSPLEFDLTGGSPEMNPHLPRFIAEVKKRGHRVRVRTNLVVLGEPAYRHLPEFFRDHGVSLTASLPCYLEENVAAQRGNGVFANALKVLARLNSLGYGTPDGLELSLVYNPGGPSLPPSQVVLEEAYKKELTERHSVSFTRLLTMANMPLGRFGEKIGGAGRCDYLARLMAAFNPATIDTLMCRRLVNIGWDGTVADCDFNRALGLLTGRMEDFDPARSASRRIRTGEHCFGCTAGLGSSCGGALAKAENQ